MLYGEIVIRHCVTFTIPHLCAFVFISWCGWMVDGWLVGWAWVCGYASSHVPPEGLFISKRKIFLPCCLWQARLNLDSLHGINFTVYFISILSPRSSRMSFCTMICLAWEAQAFPMYLPLSVLSHQPVENLH